MSDPIAKIGMHVRITKDYHLFSGFRKGDLGHIVEIDHNKSFVVQSDINPEAKWYHGFESCELVKPSSECEPHNIVWSIDVHNYTAYIKAIEFSAELAKDEVCRVQLTVSYSGNATIVTIFVNPDSTLTRQDQHQRVFGGVAIKRSEDEFSWLEGIRYGAKDALQIGWNRWDKTANQDILAALWRAVRALLQTLEEEGFNRIGIK